MNEVLFFELLQIINECRRTVDEGRRRVVETDVRVAPFALASRQLHCRSRIRGKKKKKQVRRASPSWVLLSANAWNFATWSGDQDPPFK